MTTTRRRRLLIVSRDLAVLRGHYEDVIAALSQTGVQVSIRYVKDHSLSVQNYREILRERGCDVTMSPLLFAKPDHSERVAVRLRQLANLLRFYHPDYRERGWLRELKFDKGALGPRKWARRLGRLGSHVPRLAIGLIASVDRLLPPSQGARSLVASERPDAVAAVGVIRTPRFVEVLKAAAWERIPTASWIQSWDNLSSKGLLNFTPDRVFVWNVTQRDELARYHGIPEQHVCITGAQSFDHWFDGEPPCGRAEFCAQNGLDLERPIILYLASSRQVEMSPEDFFVRWLTAIRSTHDSALEDASVFVRPHPTNVDAWLAFDLADGRVAVSPCTAADPINSPEFRRRYRNELHHASVAVALNTSGMIDAAIFGKPVCTIELPELAYAQRGTVHFEYLTTVAGGLLRTASSFEEHVRILSELVLRDPYAREERSTRFVEAFVRPHGLDVSPSSVFYDEMRRLLEAPSMLRSPRWPGRAIGRLLRWAAPVLGLPLESGSIVQRQVSRRWKPIKKWRKQRWKSGRRSARILARRSRRLLLRAKRRWSTVAARD